MTAPPLDTHAAQTASWIFMAGGALFFAASLGWVLLERRRTGTWLAALCLLGGVIASFEEAWVDRIIKLWYPADAPLVVFTAIGVHQPLYVHLFYPGFVGLGAYVTYLGLVSRPDGRWLWPVFGAICALDLLFEMPATAADVYRYYGVQPFQAFGDGWPLWVAPINAAGPVLAGWAIWKLEPRLAGVQRLLIALVPPLCYAGVYGATAWPAQTLIDSDVPGGVVWLGAGASMGLGVLIVWLIAGGGRVFRAGASRSHAPRDRRARHGDRLRRR